MKLRIISIVFLLGALINGLPYFYFQILRFIVFGTTIYVSTLIKENKNWQIVFIIIGILFNPLIPFHFPRELWWFLDLLTAIILGISIFKIKMELLEGN